MKLVTSKKQGGFTLVELVMVIVVIALLSAYIGPKFASLDRSARIAQVNKMAGSLAETIQVAKAISVVELDAIVTTNLTNEREALTAIDFDGTNSTGNASTQNPSLLANTTTIAGEDIQTEFHYPKAISSTAPTAIVGSANDALDSILNGLVAFNTTLTIFDAVADTFPIASTVVTNCGQAMIDNDGDASAANSFVAYQVESATTAGVSDAVVIFPCGAVSTEDFSAKTAAEKAAADSARVEIACYVQYDDAGAFSATGVPSTFQLPNVTTVITGC